MTPRMARWRTIDHALFGRNHQRDRMLHEGPMMAAATNAMKQTIHRTT